MATTYADEQKKKQQEIAAQPAQQGGLSGVSANTQAQLAKYQNGYQPNEQAQAAQQNLQTVQQQKPQTYNSKYGAQLDTILQEIQSPKTFKYDMNGDPLFNSYKDLVVEQAKQGAVNAQGMAAGLTGGYGNSYAQTAGAQAYQQALLPLYERVPEFASLARQNYDADISNRYRALGALQDAENAEYDRYRDTVGDWREDVAQAQDAYRDERDFGYSDYLNSLNYWNNQAAAENADMRADQDEEFRKAQLEEQIRGTDLDNDYRNRALDWNMQTDQRDFEAQQYWNTENNKLEWANLEEKQRQFDADLSEEQRQYNQKIAISYVSEILANGQMPSMELLIAAGLSYEDAQKLMAQISTGGYTPKKTTTATGTAANIVNNAGSSLLETAKDMIFASGNGIANAIQNYRGWGSTADALMDIANGTVTTSPEGRAYTGEDRAAAREAAPGIYGLDTAEKNNDAVVDAYIKNLVTNGNLGTNKESMEELLKKQQQMKELGLI